MGIISLCPNTAPAVEISASLSLGNPGAKSVKMRCGAGPLAVVAALFWTQCVLLSAVDAKKERKRLKEATPQHTETFNSTLSNSEELGGAVKVAINSPMCLTPMVRFTFTSFVCFFF